MRNMSDNALKYQMDPAGQMNLGLESDEESTSVASSTRQRDTIATLE